MSRVLSSCCSRTSSIISGSEAEASHRLCRMKMFGFESAPDTLWKKFFSACMIVDSAFATRMKTSALRQCLSIQMSKSGETSTPGESTICTSAASSRHCKHTHNYYVTPIELVLLCFAASRCEPKRLPTVFPTFAPKHAPTSAPLLLRVLCRLRWECMEWVLCFLRPTRNTKSCDQYRMVKPNKPKYYPTISSWKELLFFDGNQIIICSEIGVSIFVRHQTNTWQYFSLN